MPGNKKKNNSKSFSTTKSKRKQRRQNWSSCSEDGECTGTSGHENSGYEVRRDSNSFGVDSIVGTNNETATLNKVGEFIDQNMIQRKQSLNVDVAHNLSKVLRVKQGDGKDLQLPINQLLVTSRILECKNSYLLWFCGSKNSF